MSACKSTPRSTCKGRGQADDQRQVPRSDHLLSRSRGWHGAFGKLRRIYVGLGDRAPGRRICSRHLLLAPHRRLVPTEDHYLWTFRLPLGTRGDTYPPDQIPKGVIANGAIATQYRQDVFVRGKTTKIDLDVATVADPSHVPSVTQALGLAGPTLAMRIAKKESERERLVARDAPRTRVAQSL